jgi:hypothetical protein
MDTMTSAFLTIAATTMSVTILTALIGAVARARVRRRTTRARTGPKHRRQATRVAGILYSDSRIHPEYLPGLARARILRAQAQRMAIATSRRRPFRPARAARSS